MTTIAEATVEQVAIAVDFSVLSHDDHMTFTSGAVDDFIVFFFWEEVTLNFMEVVDVSICLHIAAHHVLSVLSIAEEASFLGQDQSEEFTVSDFLEVSHALW